MSEGILYKGSRISMTPQKISRCFKLLSMKHQEQIVSLSEKTGLGEIAKVVRFLSFLCLVSLIFQVIKALTTGFWLDEAWNSSLIHSYLHGYGWQRMISQPNEPFRGIYFSGDVTTGPAMLVPGLLISLLERSIHPPTLHIFSLLHILLIWLSLKITNVKHSTAVLSIWLVLTTLTGKMPLTHFLGDISGAAWFCVGLALLSAASASEKFCFRKIEYAGFFFGLAVLSKLVFAICLAGVVMGVVFKRVLRFGEIVLMLSASMVPIGLWHLYQYAHVGKFSLYLDVLRDFFGFATDKGMGALATFQEGKSVNGMVEDIIRFPMFGPAFTVVTLYLLTSWQWVKKIAFKEISTWFYLSWMSAAIPFAWWALVSSYKNVGGGAYIGHAVGFVAVALLPSSYLLYLLLNKCAHVLQNSNTFIKATATALAIASTAAIASLLIVRSYDYLVLNKGYGPDSSWALLRRVGYGPYTSWKEQRKLAQWINKFGSTDRLLPVVNCDASLDNAWLEKQVLIPEKVLSSGLFKSVQCTPGEMKSLSRAGAMVVFGGVDEPGREVFQGMTLVDSSGSKLSLWIPRNRDIGVG